MIVGKRVHRLQYSLGCSNRSKFVSSQRGPQRLQPLQDRLLDHAVDHGWNAEVVHSGSAPLRRTTLHAGTEKRRSAEQGTISPLTQPRTCRDITRARYEGLCSVEEDCGAGELDAGEESLGELVVTRGDGPEMFELVEETLDEMRSQ
jgi:hypothetical protein